MTGLLSRSGFNARARELIDAHPDTAFVIVYGDVDRFKVFNDLHGTDEGDRLLAFMGSLVRSSLPALGAAARPRADHFVALLPRAGFDAAEFLTRFEGWLAAYPVDFTFFVRLGVYDVDDPTLDVGLMCDRALIALREAKKAGKTKCLHYNDRLRDSLVQEQQMAGEMERALEEGQFVPYFQPQYRYATGEIAGAEVLARWNHPTRGLLGPSEFVPVFERNGLIAKLDYLMWEQACRALRSWLDRFPLEQVPRLAVNVSRADVYRDDMCAHVLGLVERYRIPLNLLHLEITEGVYLEAPEQLIAMVDELRAAGFTVAMDDFGSGYSSLNTLKDVPVDVLKLDMRFLDARNNTRGGIILASVVRMARWLNLPVIAEGVEAATQAEYLASVGCDLMQGFLFARPMDLAAFERLLEEGRRPEGALAEAVEAEGEGTAALWDAGSDEALLFNRFVGAAALAEYDAAERNVEIVRGNGEFQRMFARKRGTYERYGTNLLLAVLADEREAFVAELDRVAREGGEGEREVRLGASKEAARWVRVRMRRLSSGAGVCVLFLRFEETPRQQQRLEEQAVLQKQLYDAVPCGIIRYTQGPDARVLLLNRAACEMFGCADVDEYIALTKGDPLAPLSAEGRQGQDDAASRLRPGGPAIPFSCRAMRSDGSPLWIEGISSAAEEDGILVVQSAFNDMTLYRAQQHERTLQDYVATLCSVYDEVFEIDRLGQTSRLVHSRHRPGDGGAPMPLAEALERWCARIPDEAERRLMRSCLEESLGSSDREPRICTYSLNVGEGGVVWCQTTFLRLTDDYLLCCNKDVTDSVTAEDRRSIARVTDVVAKLPVGVGVFRYEDGRVRPQFVSETACAVLGCTWDEYFALMEEPESLPLFGEVSQELFGADLDEACERGVDREIALRRKDGERRTIRLRANVERDGDAAIAYLVAVDVTDEVRERRENSWLNERYRLLSELTNAISFDYDSRSDTVLLYLNTSGHGMEAQVIPHYLEDFEDGREGVIHPDSKRAVRALFERVRRGAQGETIEYRADYYGRGYEWYRTNLFVVYDAEGAWHLVGLIENIEHERELRRRAEYDETTGLTNPATTKKLVDAALADPLKRARCVCAIIDIDDFKLVNDSCGHVEGDALLQQVGALLRACFRESDVIGRIGGDEFVVLLKDADLDDAVAKLEDFAARLSESLGDRFGTPSTVSVGVHATTAADRTYRDAARKADAALYRAKRAGKNRVVVYAPPSADSAGA